MTVMLTDHLVSYSQVIMTDYEIYINLCHHHFMDYHYIFYVYFSKHSSTVEYLQPSGSLDFKIISCALIPLVSIYVWDGV